MKLLPSSERQVGGEKSWGHQSASHDTGGHGHRAHGLYASKGHHGLAHTQKASAPDNERCFGRMAGEKRDRLEAKASLAECCAFCVNFLWTPQQSSKCGCFKEQKHSLTVPQARGQRSRRQRGRALCEGPRGGAPGAGPCCLVGEVLFPRHLSLAEAAPGSTPLPCRQASDPLPVPFNDVNCFRIIMYGQRRGRWVCLACAWPWTELSDGSPTASRGARGLSWNSGLLHTPVSTSAERGGQDASAHPSRMTTFLRKTLQSICLMNLQPSLADS